MNEYSSNEQEKHKHNIISSLANIGTVTVTVQCTVNR